MFEHEQVIVEALLAEDDEFQRLYKKHTDLKQQVHDANLGAIPLDDFSLEKLKKLKLRLKDQMAGRIESYKREHVAI